MEELDIRIIKGNSRCGMTLFAMEIAKAIAKSRDGQVVFTHTIYPSSTFGLYHHWDKAKFLADCDEALGGNG